MSANEDACPFEDKKYRLHSGDRHKCMRHKRCTPPVLRDRLPAAPATGQEPNMLTQRQQLVKPELKILYLLYGILSFGILLRLIICFS